MVVGVGIIELFIVESRSLKEKRGIVSRLIKRTQNEFNVAIAEIGANDDWKKALIGFSVVGNDKAYINKKVDFIMNFVEGLGLAEVVDRQFEIMTFSTLLPTQDFEESKYG